MKRDGCVPVTESGGYAIFCCGRQVDWQVTHYRVLSGARPDGGALYSVKGFCWVICKLCLTYWVHSQTKEAFSAFMALDKDRRAGCRVKNTKRGYVSAGAS